MSPPNTGKPLPRPEDPALLRGEAVFTADVDNEALADAYHVAFVRSPLAAGKVTSIDASEARSFAGVVAVITAADVPTLVPFALPFGDDLAQPLLATDIGFAGQAVAAVVADSAAAAVDGAELVALDIEPATPVLDLDEALASHAVEATRYSSVDAPDDAPFESADIVVSLSQWSPRQLPAAIEGRAVAASPHGGRLLVWSAVQTPHAFKNNLARLLDVEPNTIRVTAPSVGGGFGGKVGRTAEEYLVPLLAHRLGHPVRWNETRSEHFATATQGRGERIDLTLAGSADGRFTALRAQLVKDGGAYPLVGVVLPEAYTAKVANGCYDIGHVEFSSVGVLTNRPPTSAYRGAGRSPYISALERLVDRFAAVAGIDPAEVRRRNLISPGQFPYPTPTGAVYDEADYPADLERALAVADYPALRAEQARRRQAGESVHLGIGMAAYNHMTTGGGGEEATVTVHADGTALVVTGTTSQGHGHTVTWAQIAADVLQLPVEAITVVEGDTDAIATGVGAVGSRSLQTAGMAIHRASAEVVAEAKQRAADLLEAAVGDIELIDGGFGVVGTPSSRLSWASVLAARSTANIDTYSNRNDLSDQRPADEITCGDFYDTEGRNTFPSGAHVAVVEVDAETGKVRVERVVAVDDAGTIVNPMIVEGQIHGGIASAIGQVLGEVVVHDEHGNQLTSSFLDYPLPSADQVPSLEVVPTEVASSFNSLGFKGVGESGVVGATGALHNAVIDAISHLGVTHLDLPCTPERVWSAIESAATTGSFATEEAPAKSGP